MRGVVPAHRLLHAGSQLLDLDNNCSPVHAHGDARLIRQPISNANVCQVSRPAELPNARHDPDALGKVMRLDDYGIAVGKPADLVVLDCTTPDAAIAEIAPPLSD